MASSEARFQHAKAQFDEVIGTLSSTVSEVKFKAADERTEHIRAANRLIRDGEDILKSMKADIGTMGPAQRRTFNKELAQRQTDLDSQRAALRRDVERLERAALMGGGAAAPHMTAEEKGQRQKLLQTEAASSATTAHLHYARATMYETEEMGQGTLTSLEGQGQQLRGIRDKVDNVSSFADMGRSILNEMETRAMKNQLLLWLAILLLMGAVGVVIYYGYIQDPKK